MIPISEALNFSISITIESGCTGLNTAWENTITTTTQFPVDSGTVVEITCSNSDAVNGGSSEVTCTTGTDFTFSIEPSCSIAGLSHKPGY